jgi:glycosyltransferase involved in cell wall biosynthesis
MNSKKFRFAVVISHPIQHYSPLFRALAEIPGLHVRVFYLCDHGIKESYDPGFGQSFAWDVPLLDGYEYEILKQGFSPKKFGFFEIDFPELGEKLDEFSPHAIWIHGYGQMISWRALRWAKNRSAVIYFGDSELLHKRRLIPKMLKSFLLKYFFKHCDAFLTIGDRNEEYYDHYGVPQEKMFRGACPVDVGRFVSALQKTDRSGRSDIRKRYGIPEKSLVVITLGKLIPIKRNMDLIRAICIAKQRGVIIFGLLIGDGILRSAIEEYAQANRIENQVKITGFINQKDIPYYIEAGDILAMPSEKDAHPLAVTESLILGLPVVVSDKVGCVGPTDTARPNVNALVYPCGDIPALTEALCTLAGDSALRKRMSQESLNIAHTQDVSITVWTVIGILLALKKRFAISWSDIDPRIFKKMKELFSNGRISHE